MYAVISTGGKQYRVEEGQVLDVERLSGDDEVRFTPVLLVDGDTVVSKADELSGAGVTAKVVAHIRGKKIDAFDYKSKANQRRRWGHRQAFTTIEVTGISR